MLVSVTGGTGFVGAHSVAELLRAGHRVRLLVRDESTVDKALSPLGVDASAVDVVVGNVLDEGRVAAAVRGADAVLHAAGVYSFDSRRHAAMRRVNERGTEVVLGAAVRAGAGRVVHVSSVGALLPARGRVLGPDTPVGRSRQPYLASKAAAERVARAHQADGAPVVISYPPALLGPHDPHLGDQAARVRNVLRGLTPIWPLGGLPVGDVRDTAAVHARLVTGAGGPGAFGPAHYVSTRRFVGTLRVVTGRRLPAVFLPARAMLPVGRLADLARKVWPRPIPAEHGAIYLCACATRVAPDAPTLGIPARPVADTLRETVSWLHAAGHVSARQAGLATVAS